MNVLITGNMGYVGPCVVSHFRQKHPTARIIGLDLGYFATCLVDSRRLPEHEIDEQHFCDVRSVPADLLQGVDAVVHLAGLSNDPLANRFADVTMAVNYHATVELAKRARRAGVRSFVFASSCSVYGCAEESARTEDSEAMPLTPYALSKVLAERALAELACDRFIVTCLRFSTACGFSPRLRLDLVLNDFVASAVTASRILILSDGSPWRPLIHVRDMARALEWAAQRQAGQGGEFRVVNAGSDGWNYQVRDLAAAVADAIPGTEVTISPDARPDKRSYRVNFDLFRRLAPEHQPRIGLAETIVEMQQALLASGFQGAEAERFRFIRLKALSDLIDRGYLDTGLRWARVLPAESKLELARVQP